MGSKGSKDQDGDGEEYPHASILRGSAESDNIFQETSDNSQGLVNGVSTSQKLTIWTAMVFVVGEMAGSGVLALPRAIENSGWIGLVLLVFCCASVGWCGVLLGRCWLIIEERFPEYQDHCRDPYPSIAYEAFGKPAKIFVSVCINVTLTGVAIVFLLLAAENINAIFINVPALHFSPCFWMLIVIAVLAPFTWMGTPKDFWPVAVGATVATALACLLLLVAIATFPEAKVPSEVTHDHIDILSFALSFGTILFSFGGAAAFPTIQHDMKNPSHFPVTVVLAFTVLMAMYLPVSALAYSVLGNQIEDNILITLSANVTWEYYAIQALICVHLLFAFVIVVNPPCQELEKLLKMPTHFTWKRVVSRTLFVLLVLFIAETIPHFGPIQSLIGGSTTTILAIICPCACYLKLTSMQNLGWPERKALLHEKVFCVEIVIIGVLGGIVSTYSAIEALANPETLVPPCYVNITI